MIRALKRMFSQRAETWKPEAPPDLDTTMRVEPGTFEVAADLAALAERLDFGGNDAAAIRNGIVAPDLAEWVRTVEALRKPSIDQILRGLDDMHREASSRVTTAKTGTQRKRWERAALYCSNARTFYQAAKMQEETEQ